MIPSIQPTMSLITPPTAPRHDFILTATRAHESQGLSFDENFDWLFTNGYIFKGPDYFLMGYEDARNDAWVIWWAETHPNRKPLEMMALFLKLIPYYRSQVGWARLLKNKPFKFYSTERLLQFIRR